MNQEIYDRFLRLSASFIPEWRFDSQGNDMGSGLAQLFLSMMEDTYERFGQLPEYLRYCFFQSFHVERREAEHSEGYLTCNLVKDTMPEGSLKAGTVVIAQKEQGERVRFELADDLYVTKSAVDTVRFYQGMWYIKLTSGPESALLHLLVLPGSGGGEEYQPILEYYGSHGWQTLEMSDGTGGLTHSGIIKFAGRQDYRKLSCFKEEGIFIRLKDRNGRALSKEPAAFYMNGVKARSLEGGSVSNVLPDSRLKLEETAGFISRIENPDLLGGGGEAESGEEAETRMANRFLHRDRAVTTGDFEQLARETYRGIFKVRCFAGYDESGNRNSGHVTLVVLIREGPIGSRLFYQAKERLYRGLLPCMNGGLRGRESFHITAPVFVRFDVTARIEVRSVEDFMSTGVEAKKALEKYLCPYEGWAVGNLPGLEGIRHVLVNLPSVLFVRRIYVSCYVRRNGVYSEVELEALWQFPWGMPESGRHEVIMSSLSV